jgi:hypothetical protein
VRLRKKGGKAHAVARMRASRSGNKLPDGIIIRHLTTFGLRDRQLDHDALVLHTVQLELSRTRASVTLPAHSMRVCKSSEAGKSEIVAHVW